MKQVYWMLEVKIKDGEVDALKALLADMVKATQNDEPGTLNYEWWINGDETSCHIYERYADSSAVMVHLGNFGAKFAGRFMAILEPTRLMVYGDVSDEVRKALDGLGAIYMSALGGFGR